MLALVGLAEGPQLMSTIERSAYEEVEIGMSVRPAFERVGDEIGLVRFVPAS